MACLSPDIVALHAKKEGRRQLLREQDWFAGDGSVLLSASFSISGRAAR